MRINIIMMLLMLCFLPMILFRSKVWRCMPQLLIPLLRYNCVLLVPHRHILSSPSLDSWYPTCYLIPMSSPLQCLPSFWSPQVHQRRHSQACSNHQQDQQLYCLPCCQQDAQACRATTCFQGLGINFGFIFQAFLQLQASQRVHRPQ